MKSALALGRSFTSLPSDHHLPSFLRVRWRRRRSSNCCCCCCCYVSLPHTSSIDTVPSARARAHSDPQCLDAPLTGQLPCFLWLVHAYAPGARILPYKPRTIPGRGRVFGAITSLKTADRPLAIAHANRRLHVLTRDTATPPAEVSAEREVAACSLVAWSRQSTAPRSLCNGEPD